MSKTQLSRADMERVISEGGSVLHQGQHISKVADLPSEADLAQGDEAKEDAVIAGYDAEIDALKKKKDDVFQQRGLRAKAHEAETAKAAAKPELVKEPAKTVEPTPEPVHEPVAPEVHDSHEAEASHEPHRKHKR